MEDIQYIKRIEIKGLFGRYDLEWDLAQDVNILSGVNGSGKSTILECIDYAMVYGRIPDRLIHEITFFRIISNTGEDFFHYENRSTQLNSHNRNKVIVDFIKTFDIHLKPIEAIQKLSDKSVTTDLDWDIYKLQEQYLKYQIRLSKKIIEILQKNGVNSNYNVLELQKKQQEFRSMLNNIFSDTNKIINKETDEISFFFDEKILTAYQLSSGEKQMLIILLTVLIQDLKPSILIMDEPELSLHFDWQKKLIQYIKELNPNVQIILATHSPAIIMEGWLDKVTEVTDLITNREGVAV